MKPNALRKAGLKSTLPRQKILEILQQNHDDHLSAEDIYRKLMEDEEEIGLATIYRVLSQFEDAGLITRHHFEDGRALFELDQGHHDHIVCLKCGRIEEFLDEEIEHLQHEIAKRHGYNLSRHTLILYGECMEHKCKEVGQKKNSVEKPKS